MKKKLLILLMTIIACVGLFRVGMIAGAASSTPGSVGDPLITKSYLEQRLSELSSGSTESGYVKVTVSKGKSFYANEGTEFVLYSGSASVIGNSGIINLTSGELFKKGNTAVKYSSYLSPASQSGVKATSQIILYVKGKYSIK